MDSEFSLYRTTSIASEFSYPYITSDGTRKTRYATAILSSGVTDYMDVLVASGMMSALDQQPVSVAIEVDPVVFQNYKNGTITAGCGANLDHDVLAASYYSTAGCYLVESEDMGGTSATADEIAATVDPRAEQTRMYNVEYATDNFAYLGTPASIPAKADVRLIDAAARRCSWACLPAHRCSRACFNYNGCGDDHDAWSSSNSTGVVTGGDYGDNVGETCHRYSSPQCPTTCEGYDPSSLAADKFHAATTYGVRGEDQIMADFVANFPSYAACTAYSDFPAYKSGAYEHMTSQVLGGHAMTLIRYGVENGAKHWKIKNSWNEH